MPLCLKDETMAERLTLDILQSLTPFQNDGSDAVTEASRDLLMGAIKCHERIHDVFFQNYEAPPGLKLVDFRSFPIDKLAQAFVAQAIAKVKDTYGFHLTINKEAVDAILMDIYESLHWKKLGRFETIVLFAVYMYLYHN